MKADFFRTLRSFTGGDLYLVSDNHRHAWVFTGIVDIDMADEPHMLNTYIKFRFDKTDFLESVKNVVVFLDYFKASYYFSLALEAHDKVARLDFISPEQYTLDIEDTPNGAKRELIALCFKLPEENIQDLHYG